MKHLNALSIALLVSSNLFAVKQGKVWKLDSAQSGQPAATQPTSPTSPMAPVTTTDASAQPAAAAAASTTDDNKQDAPPAISRLQRLITEMGLPKLEGWGTWWNKGDLDTVLEQIQTGKLDLSSLRDVDHTERIMRLLVEKEKPAIALPYLAKILAEVKKQKFEMNKPLAKELVQVLKAYKEDQLRVKAEEINKISEQIEIIKVSETAAKISGSVQDELSDDEGYCGTNSLVIKMNSRKLLT